MKIFCVRHCVVAISLPAAAVRWAPQHGVREGQAVDYLRQNWRKFFLRGLQKQKIISWLAEHDDVTNMTSLLAPGSGIF